MSDVIDLNNAKVLMVDDTPANIDVLRKILTPEGYKLSFANNGEKTLQIAARSLPDLILLDVMMPGIDGFETCRRLKQDVMTREIPVIFITAKIDPEDVVEGFRVGAIDYLTKPFRQEEVCTRIRTHLQTRLLAAQRDNLLSRLRRSEESFRFLTNCSPLGIFQTDPQGQVTDSNQQWQQLLGLNADQAHGSTWLQMIHPEDRERVQTLWHHTLTTAQQFTAKFRLASTPDQLDWIQAQAVALLTGDHQIDGLIGMMRVLEK